MPPSPPPSTGSLVTTGYDRYRTGPNDNLYAVWGRIPTDQDGGVEVGHCSYMEYGIVLGHMVEPPGRLLKINTHWSLVVWSHGVVGWTVSSLLKTVHIPEELE